MIHTLFKRLGAIRDRCALVDDWAPARLTKGDCTLLITAILALSFVRSGDYLIGNDDKPRPPGQPPGTILLADAFPLRGYGIALLVLIVWLVIGWLLRWHSAVWWGHGLMMLLYLILFVGTLIPILHVSNLDGIRGASALLGPMVIHFLFWRRTGPEPLQSSRQVVIETIRKPE